MRRRNAHERRIWTDGYVTGYRAANERVQIELRAEYARRAHGRCRCWRCTSHDLTRLLRSIR